MTGAPTPDPFSDRQLQSLERLVDRMVAQQLGQRMAAAELHRDTRLAKTVGVSSSYPTSGNTFKIRFLDCAFNPLTPGSTTLTALERTTETDADDSKDVSAREINGLYIPEGTLVFAMWQRGLSGDPASYGEWWISAGDGVPLKQFCDFTLGAALAQTASSVAGTITSQYGQGVDHASTSITLLNRALHSGASPAYTYHGASGDTGCAVYTGTGTIWTIWDLECPHA